METGRDKGTKKEKQRQIETEIKRNPDKESLTRWPVPVIPATWEDEEGESLEPGKQRLQ